MMAGSSVLAGANPLAWSCAALAALCQLSLVAMTDWSDERTSVSVGLASALGMPNGGSEGPVATIATVFGVEPPITKPPIITSLPESTCTRVDRFVMRAEATVAVPQLPLTPPPPLKRKSIDAAQPAVMAICVGLALPMVTGAMGEEPL